MSTLSFSLHIFSSDTGNRHLAPCPPSSRIVSNPSSSHLTDDAPELAREKCEFVHVVDIGRREQPTEEAFERREEGRGIVAGLLRAESKGSLLSLAALLLLFPPTEKTAVAAAAARVGAAPTLGPTMFAPPTNTELVKYAPAPTPADEVEEVDSSSVRAAIRPGLVLNTPTSKLEV